MSNIGGPQSDRSKILSKPSKPLHRGDIIGSGGGKIGFESETVKLRNENDILKDTVRRYAKELQFYQKASGITYADDGMATTADFSTLTSLKPLLGHYDVHSKQMEVEMKRMSTALEQATDTSNQLFEENKELKTMNTNLLKNESHKENIHNLHNQLPSESLADMTKKLDILMVENQTIQSNYNDISNEMEKLQDDLAERDGQVEDLSSKASALHHQLKTCSVQGKQTEKERDEAAREAVAISDELGKMNSELIDAREKREFWQQKYHDAKILIEDMKKEMKKLDEDAREAGTTAMRQTKVADDRLKELQVKLMTKTQEADTNTELVRKLRREYQSIRQDAEGMLQVMSGLERQVEEYTTREADVESKARESRQQVEEALTERDKALARENQNKLEVQKLLEERRKTAEQRQGEMETITDQAREKAMEQVRTCEHELQNMAESLSKLQLESEQSIREGRAAKEILDRSNRLHDDEKRNLENVIKDLRESLSAAIIGKDEEAAKKVDIQENNKELRNLVDKLRLDVDALQVQLNAAERTKLTEVSNLKIQVRQLQKDLSEKQRECVRKENDVTEQKTSYESKMSTVEKKLEDEVEMFRRRTLEAEKAVKEFEASADSESTRMQNLLDQIKDKTAVQTQQLETSLTAEEDKAKRLNTKVRELDASVENLGEEKGMLVIVVEEARNTITDLQSDLMNAKNTILDLTESLSESHSAREQASNRALMALGALNQDKTRAAEEVQ